MARIGAPRDSRYLGRNRRQSCSPRAMANIARDTATTLRSSPSQAARLAPRLRPETSADRSLEPGVETVIDPIRNPEELQVVLDDQAKSPDYRIQAGRFGGVEPVVVDIRLVHYGCELAQAAVVEVVLQQDALE